MERFSKSEDGGKTSQNAPGRLTFDELSKIEKTKRNEIIELSAQEIIDTLKSSGATEFRNVSEMYKVLESMNLIARREDPLKVIDAVRTNSPIVISFPEGERYSNAVMWNPTLGSRGIENAYLEGYSHFNGVVTVLGFKNSESLDIENMPDASQRFAGLPREYVRSIQGRIPPDKIVFVSLRIPIYAFSRDAMSPEEKERYEEYTESHNKKPEFIHRGFLFTQNLAQ